MTTQTRPRPSLAAAPPPGRRARRAGWAGTPLRGLLPLLVLLVVWQLVGNPDSASFPPPSKWLEAVKPVVSSGKLWTDLAWTAGTFVVGLAAATLIGASVGAITGSSIWADRALGPLIDFTRSTPAAALVPVATLVLGYTMEMKILVVILPTLWPTLMTCRTARKAMSPVLLDSARTLRLGRFETALKITTPSLVRAALLGVRVAAPLALIMTLLVEIVTQINGLGGQIGIAQANYQSALVYALLVITGVLAFLVNSAVNRLEAAVAARTGDSSMQRRSRGAGN